MSFWKIKKIGDILGTIPELPVGHYEYFGEAERYAVWAEDMEQASVQGDNFKVNQAIQGTIDLFTKIDMDPTVDQIQEALKAEKISFYLNSVQYEDETGFIHFEWVWGYA